ncbi:MAG: PAS domain-containing protein [Mangrovibacterium sp.]
MKKKNEKEGMEDIEMKKYLNIDNERIKKMLDIKFKVFKKEITPAEARKLVNETFDHITPEEFAYGEQHLLDFGITDEIMVEGMDDILDVFRDVLVSEKLNLPKGHPIQNYADEAAALEQLLLKMERKLGTLIKRDQSQTGLSFAEQEKRLLEIKNKFIKNEWLEFYEKLDQINIHFSRKQHQLFSALEKKGFDRPSKVMWTFDNGVRDAIKAAYDLLVADQDIAFIEAQPNVFYLVRDILKKERDVLYPTALQLLTEEEFADMHSGDDEIGYCLIEKPPLFKDKRGEPGVEATGDTAGSLIKDLQGILEKHGISTSDKKDEILDVSTGKLTLEQINLIFKHQKVDLSYVDEHDIVKFYTDTKHRVFPRSKGVIGRKVQNCHPRESVYMVEEIINAFRNGEQDEAEFWLDKGDKFIYIVYNAVRDDEGNFRGVLEMMQDVTHIRSLTGSRRLLTWDKNKPAETEKQTSPATNESSQKKESTETEKEFKITPNTVVGPLIRRYPFIKEYLVSLSPKFSQLNNPVIFKTMGNIATLDMISKRGGLQVEELIQKITAEIERHKG